MQRSGSELPLRPAQDGCTLYELLTDPSSVNVENVTGDIFGVSLRYGPPLSAVAAVGFLGCDTALSPAFWKI
jgi:hypothetical protein